MNKITLLHQVGISNFMRYFFLALISFFVQINLSENYLNRISSQIVTLRDEGFPQFEDHCHVDLLSFNSFL